jgi:hypothetical protein
MAANYVLTYFDAKGVAQVSRLAFQWAGIAFEDRRVSWAEWLELKASTPFGQLPMLELKQEALKFAQSHAIARYVGKLAGLVPEEPEECLGVDALLDSVKDVHAKLGPTYAEPDEAKKKALREQIRDSFILPLFSAWERMLEAGVNAAQKRWQFFTVPTIADLGVYALLDQLPALDYMGQSLLDSFPLLRRFVAEVAAALEARRDAAASSLLKDAELELKTAETEVKYLDYKVREAEKAVAAAAAQREAALKASAAAKLFVLQKASTVEVLVKQKSD